MYGYCSPADRRYNLFAGYLNKSCAIAMRLFLDTEKLERTWPATFTKVEQLRRKFWVFMSAWTDDADLGAIRTAVLRKKGLKTRLSTARTAGLPKKSYESLTMHTLDQSRAHEGSMQAYPIRNPWLLRFADGWVVKYAHITTITNKTPPVCMLSFMIPSALQLIGQYTFITVLVAWSVTKPNESLVLR